MSIPPASPPGEPPPVSQELQTPPLPRRSRKILWITLATLGVLVAGGVTALVVTNKTQPIVATARPAPVTTVALSPADRFYADVLDTPGLTTDMSKADMVGLAVSICDAVGTPGVTRENLTTAMGTTKFGPAVATVLVDAATRSYCPEKSFSSAPAATLPPALGGSGYSDGTYEVGAGAGQMPAGKYKSTGPGGGAGICYYSRLKNNDGASGDIIANDVSKGPSVLTVKPSDGYVKVQGCTFTPA